MMEYRMEIDALNAIVIEQRRTNELLEQLLARSSQEVAQKPTEHVQDVKKPQVRGKRV